MDVILHKGGQYEVAQDTHRYRIVDAGRRWGKSTLLRMVILKWAVEMSDLYWIVSPTYRQAKMIHWSSLQREVPQKWIKEKNKSDLSIVLQNESKIELRGAENPDALRGVALGGLGVDEIASIRNWKWLWDEVLRATLTDKEAPAMFISTPKGFNHFYELFEQGQVPGSDYKSWKFTSYDNPHIPSKEIDRAKAELTEDTFAQEYLADFRKFTGLVYKEFERDIHVIDSFKPPTEWEILRGMDFGSTNPTVCLWITIDGDGNWYVYDEHYEVGQTIDYHAGRINSKTGNLSAKATYGDPSGAQWIKEFAERGVYITPADKETGSSIGAWVSLGIEKVGDMLKPVPGHFVAHTKKDNQPKLFVTRNCENTIREFEAYRWKEKKVTQAQDLNEPDSPEKANDHAMDALRYVVVSYVKKKYGVFPKDETVERLKGQFY